MINGRSKIDSEREGNREPHSPGDTVSVSADRREATEECTSGAPSAQCCASFSVCAPFITFLPRQRERVHS